MGNNTLSPDVQPIVDTRPASQSTFVMGDSSTEWRKVVDMVLDFWNEARAGISIELEAPTEAVIRHAISFVVWVAREIAPKHSILAPTRIVPDGGGGIVLSRSDPDGVYRTIEIRDDCSITASLFENNRLRSRVAIEFHS